MDKVQALQNLLEGKATEYEIALLKQALVSGEISIGRDVNRSVVIIGSGNKVELTSEALRLLQTETTSEESVEGEPPYMGLHYFDTSDAVLFYGREALTRELLARVEKESFLAIVGASGSGKTSVARAGLIPVWTKENEQGAVHVITPTAHPLESLAASLTRESESVTATATLVDDLKNDSRSLRLYVKKSFGEVKSLLLVDQFEETFTSCKDADERKAFIENLLSLADDDAERAARVVITMRADFYHHCAEYEGLRQALQIHQAYIGAMTTDELRQAITTPAEKNGWDFQPGLVDLILQDVGAEPGALPLLSHALLETWNRRQGHTLTLKGYTDTGGVKKAIAHTAENVYDRLTPAEQTIARRIFLRLTELGDGVQDTRRRVKLDELAQTKEQEVVTRVLKILTDARLVTTAHDSAEVAHEALIREWGTLRRWLDEGRESLRLHRHLTERAQEWEYRGYDSSELYNGVRLNRIKEWAKECSDQLSTLEGDFLKASIARLQRERRSTILRWGIVVTAGLLVVLTVALAMIGQFNRFVFQPLDMNNYWVTIPAGEFQMGSEDEFYDEKPVHTVYLDAFEIGRYEVTNRQYTQCVRASICTPPSNEIYSEQEYETHPVISVSWYDARTFCEWAGGRLPTEAEWEKAARGDLKGKTYPWGNEKPVCVEGAPNGAGGGDCPRNTLNQNTTMPVGSFISNGYGLFDMAGNVSEWVNDRYSENYYSQAPFSNPAGPKNGDARVVRDLRWDTSIALRSWADPTFNVSFGFRCAHNVFQSQESLLTATAFAPRLSMTSTSYSQIYALTVTAYAPKFYTYKTAIAQTATVDWINYQQTMTAIWQNYHATETPTPTPSIKQP